MQQAREIYDAALAADVLLYPKDGALAYKAARGIPPVLRQQILDNKQALLDYLTYLELEPVRVIVPAAAIVPLADRQCLPVSHAQRRIWFAAQQSADGSQFNIQGCFLFEGELDASCFRQALQALGERHEVLRVNFVEIDGELRQRAAAERTPTLALLDLRGEPAAARDALARGIIAEDLRTPFDLAHDALMRVTLVRMADDRHLAIFNIHHIVADGWSVGLMIDEFCQAYAAFHNDVPLAAAPTALQYADFSAWQEAGIRDGALEDGLAFWRSRLEGMPEVHGLPLDKTRPALQSFDGGLHQGVIGPELTERIAAFCRSRKLTPFMFLESVLAAVLSLYGGENDIAVGTPVAGRLLPETESMIGVFVNTVVLRTRLDHAKSFDDLLHENRAQILEAFAHQHVPLESLIAELGHRRSPSYSPLFQVWFVLQNNRRVDFALPDCRVTEYADLPPPAAKFELNLYAQEVAGEIRLDWVFNRDIFEASSIAYVAGEFLALVQAVLDAPGQALSSHRVFAPSSTPMPVSAMAGELPPLASIPGAGGHGLVEALRARFDTHAMSTALVSDGVAWSYRDLDALACRYRSVIANSSAAGPVGLLFDKGPQVVAAMLAALGLQRAYVNLDPAYPQARLAYMVEHAGCGVILADAPRQALAQAVAGSRPLVCGLPEGSQDSGPGAAADDNALAYILYTSGSTGQPKGVVQTQRNLGYQAASYSQALGLTPQDRILQLASYSFDASVLDTYGALLAGAAVHLMDVRSAPAEELLQSIRDQGITVFHSTPTVFKYLFAQAAPGMTASVRVVVLGGEAVDEHTARLFRSAFGDECRLIGLYGASEASLVSLAEITAAEIDAGMRPHMGRSIPGTEMLIRAEDGRAARVFETGQIIIRGRHVAHGYWDDAALTSERFVRVDDGMVEYSSGDMGYLLPGGQVRFVGRRDTQVKLNGIRIELGEVEIALRQLEDIVQAAVLIRGSASGEASRLLAYVVSRAWLAAPDRVSHQPTLMQQYRARLQEWLPDYMIPAGFVFLERLPVTPSGKTDYRALPAADEGAFEASRFVAPRTPVEQALCELWQDVLGRELVGVSDDFFSMGGDSLLALRLIARIRERFGVELTVREWFTQPTVEALAVLLESATDVQAGTSGDNGAAIDALLAELAERGVRIYLEGSALKTQGRADAIDAELGGRIRQHRDALVARLQEPGRAPAEPDVPYALSFAQQRLWFLDRFGGSRTGYNMPMALRLEGKLDRGALVRALEEIVARHAVLRSVYRTDGGQGAQVIEPMAPLPVELRDLQHLTPEGQVEALADLARSEQAQPFDLGSDRMLRATLARLAQDAHVLYLTLHHIAADGWSLGILAREFATLYQAFSAQQANPLAPLTMQYAEFAVWQRQHLGQERLQKELSYWREKLDGIPQVHGLPLDKLRPPEQSARGRVVRQRLDGARLDQLRRFAAGRQASLFMVLQSAFALLLARWSGEREVVIGTPVAGRPLPATETLIGCFVNTLVLRTQFHGPMSFDALLQASREQLLAAYEHQQAPFELLVESLNPARSLSHGPLFQVMFALQNYQFEPVRLPDLSVEEMPLSETNAKFDLGVIAHEQADGLMVHWVFADALFEEATIAAMAAGFDALLQALVEAPGRDIFDLPLEQGGSAVLPSAARSGDKLVLDPNGRVQPAGAFGEIHVFDPAGATPWRSCGLVGRALASGEVVALGRLAADMHVNGARVPTLEIEALLAGLEQVAEVYVAVRRTAGDDARRVIVAYVVPEPGADFQQVVARCREQARIRLPDYLSTHSVIAIDALPRGIDGLVDEASLPLPDASFARQAYAAPSDALESELCDIWAGILSLERVGVHDNFFQIGGASLHCILVQQEILQRTGHEINVTHLFAHPTVSELARTLRSGSTAQAGRIEVAPNLIPADASAITPEMLPLIELTQDDIDRIAGQAPGGLSNIQDIYALTPLQEGILFHYQLTNEGDPYVLSADMSFPDRARLDRFLSAVQQVVDRHDVLRTCFFWGGLSNPAQVVLRHARLAVTEIALDPRQGPVAEQMKSRFDVRRTRMDLGRAPLLDYVVAHDPERDRWVVLQRSHHLLGDHDTIGALRSEVLAILGGQHAALPPTVPFREMVGHILAAQKHGDHERFFRAMLGDVTEPTLPFGLTDVHHEGTEVSEYRARLPEELSGRLRAHARNLGVGVASLFHLAWALVLGRCAASERVVFGTVLLGRLQAGELASRAMGLSMNTLPLRVDLDATGVAEALRCMHARLAELLEHEQAPLALAQHCSAVPRKTPIFNAVLNYRHSIEEAGSVEAGHPFADIEFGPLEERTNYPVTLAVDDYGQALGMTAQVLMPLSGARLYAYVQQALESLAGALERAPGAPLRMLDVLPAAERDLMLHAWNETTAPYRLDRCAHQLFEEQVLRSPHAVALVNSDTTLTYEELNRQANRLAHHLIAHGVTQDQVVAICVQRGPAMVIGLLAIWKAGGAYLPLDPVYPSDRLTRIVADAAPRVVLLDAAGRAALGEASLEGALAVPMEGAADTPAWAERSVENPQVPALASAHLAYVIYTSGSTGMPKGVQIEHRQLTNFLCAMAEQFAITPADPWLAVTSVAFDIAGLELFLPLVSGAPVVLAGHADAIDPARLQQLMRTHGVRILQATPATWKALMSSGWEGDANLIVLCGGEPMPAHFPAWFQGRCKALWNLYGPTETTIWSSCRQLVPGPVETGGSVPIGRPLANTRIYVLDASAQPVPLGATGELYIGGEGVARGYLNRPELTQERFLPDPFAVDPAARMYRTGDLARFRPDGSLECLGRNDDQVKIRGFRIELGEIEACLHEHAQVREAAVAVHQGTEPWLAAYVVAADSESDEAGLVAVLREYLLSRLPKYMVPAAIVRIDRLPLTPNGKLDRKALPQPGTKALAQSAYEAPKGEIEGTLALLWQDLLGVERVGRQDDFFELGGHSLLVVRLLARVRQELGVELPVATMFAKPTLAEFAQALCMPDEHTPTSVDAPILLSSRDGLLPLSFAQQRMWFLAQWEGVSANYHMAATLRMHGVLNRDVLRAAFDALLSRHESLRSVFDTVDGGPCVRLLPPSTPFPLVEQDLRADPGALADVIRSEIAAPFDLTQGPLVRARLLHIGADEHVLQLTQHHIVTDGWSLGVLVRELSALYSAFSAGQDNPLAPLAIQYPDYAAWQRQWLSGERLQKQTQYWRDALADAPVLLELPTDRPRPPQQSLDGAALPVEFDAGLTNALRQLSRRHGTTLFMTLLAAWSAVLSRLSGQDQVVVGTPTANRGRRETEGLIGLFVNTLALPVSLAGAPSVGELLARVRNVTLGAQDHQDLPFEQVVEIVQPPRRLDHTPIFQVMLSWQKQEQVVLDLAGLEVSPAEAEVNSAKFDLELNLNEVGDTIRGNLTYASALFDAATIERQLGYLRTMLEAMAGNDARCVAAVDLLSAQERALQDSWNATDTPYPHGRCIHQLIEAQVRLSPEAIALVYQEQQLSYAQLNAQANRLAHHLIALGAGPYERVAICVDRGPVFMIGLLAILKAGAGYVPLDPSYPAERLRHVVQDSTPALVLADAIGRQVLDPASLDGQRVVALDALYPHSVDSPEWAACPDSDPQLPALTPRHLAYVIYTSVSTGSPKGVMIEHGSLCNQIAALQRSYGLGPQDRVLQFAGPSFDMSVEEIFGALASGAALVLGDRSWIADPQRWRELCESHGLTVANLPTQFWQLLAQDPRVPVAATLRQIAIGGEAVTTAALEAWWNKPGHKPVLWNAYGPTEATVNACLLRCAPDVHPRSIGKPLANMRIYLLDAHGNRVPTGAIGELYIGGAGVARGYLNRPQLNAERFLPDPFSSVPGARMYKSGDLARYLPDGQLEFLGRNDHQVKIRGLRIELGEIATLLSAHPSVRDALVVAREESGDRRLVAYVIAPQDLDDTSELVASLRTHLASSLPDYIVPSAFVRMAAWPLTPNGKLDRDALPVPGAAAYMQRGYEAPVGEFERKIAQLWEDLLGFVGVERIGRHDDFFALGGHSLLAVSMLARVRQVTGCELQVETLFANSTLAGFARALAEAYARPRPQLLAPIPVAPREGELPLSFAQQRMWFLAQWEGVGASYHMPATLRMYGALDRGALRAAFDALLCRHESLRSVFDTVDGEPRVRLLPPSTPFPLVEQDLRADHDALDEVIRTEIAAPFDLAQGPLVRARLLHTGEDEHVLQLTQHHIVSDGWSIEVLARELSQLYGAFQAGQANPLATLPVQYLDYAAWQRQWLGEERAEQQKRYWREALADAPALLQLPTDRARPERHDVAGAEVRIALGVDLTTALKSVSSRHRTTTFMTLLAAWAVVLSRLSGQDDVVIGAPVANRRRPEFEALAGLFVNTLALRIRPEQSGSVHALLSQVRETVQQAQAHQDLPFDQVVEAVRPQRNLDHAPIFQVLFNWENDAVRLPGFGNLQVEPAATSFDFVKFDLELSLAELDGQVVGSLKYATSLFDASTIERHAAYLQTVLKAMLADGEQALAQVDLVAPEERELQLYTWNATRAPYPHQYCLHQLFEQQVARTPDATAVVFQDQALSYRELNAEANRLAHHLLVLGVKVEDRVAICVERSVAMVTGLLAILKAGAAYVPLDPGYPSERLAQIVQDAAPAALLCDGAGRTALDGLAPQECALVDADNARAWACRPATNPEVAGLGPRNLVYVIYTSGSTGIPKGVMNEHGPVVNRLTWMQDAYALDATDVVIQKTPFSFDVSVWEFFWTLLNGATLQVAPPDMHKDPVALIEFMVRNGVTTAHFVPSMLGLFLMTPGAERCTSLRRIICSGEALQPAQALGFLEKLPGAQLHNLYGPTEAAIDVTAWTCPASYTGGVVPIGRPIANVSMYVLDAALRPVPLGAAGDLYIGGVAVARGYHNRPQLNAERFVRDPFQADPAARMYRTGDLARYRPDGNLEYLGRDDFQVKLRGLRIELGEIEAKLAEHEQVGEAVVLVRDMGGEQRLVAYVLQADVAQPMPAPELAAALRAHLARSVPEQLLPAAYVPMQAWPLTPNGKLDRKAFPAPAGDAYAQKVFEEPQGELEQTVAGLWRDLLEVERVGRQDSFFELGGSSLLAVRMLSELQLAIDMRVELTTVFKYPNLGEFCKQVLFMLIEQQVGAGEFENFINSEGQGV